MTEQLHITLVQSHLHWENPVANRKHFEDVFHSVSSETHLVVLPEMFTTGFSMRPVSLAETMDGDTIQWLKRWSQKLDAAICGSVIIQEKDQYFNRFLFVKPDGNISHYDKRHTFNMAGEGDFYQTGKTPIIIEYLGWKIFPQVCYDLRFPVFSRNTSNYDILMYVANWPKARVSAWDALLKARAIENMSYCVGVNRVGLDGNNLEYVGHSGVYDALGDEVAFAKAEEKIIDVILSKEHIHNTRERLPFLNDKDTFKLL